MSIEGEIARNEAQDLHRTLGPWQLIALGIGAIIGAGIFVITGHAAASYAGPGVVISFIVAGAAAAVFPMPHKVLIIVGDATETVDTLYPYYRLEEGGYEPVVAGPEKRRFQMVLHEVKPGCSWCGHTCVAPSRHASHAPQPSANGTTTASPTRQRRTPSPTADTTPAYSSPK